MARSTYTREFKLEAVRLLDAGERPAAETARALGIKREQLYRWREQLRRRGPEGFRDRAGRPAQSETAEVLRLKRELARVSEERDILKKAAAYFARELP